MRSIPAWAGQSIPRPPKRTERPVYPRVGGAIFQTHYLEWGKNGLSPRGRGNQPSEYYQRVALRLSPRVRGNRIPAAADLYNARSIPACAGQSKSGVRWYRFGGVYPRVCGAIWAPDLTAVTETGLSPRVRGNLSGIALFQQLDGSIPACAGQSGKRSCRHRFSRVYPRVCGAISMRCVSSGNGAGLSPRVRGNLPVGYEWLRLPGSIPACAGQSAGA